MLMFKGVKYSIWFMGFLFLLPSLWGLGFNWCNWGEELGPYLLTLLFWVAGHFPHWGRDHGMLVVHHLRDGERGLEWVGWWWLVWAFLLYNGQIRLLFEGILVVMLVNLIGQLCESLKLLLVSEWSQRLIWVCPNMILGSYEIHRGQ